jgi:hypothetical protein
LTNLLLYWIRRLARPESNHFKFEIQFTKYHCTVEANVITFGRPQLISLSE